MEFSKLQSSATGNKDIGAFYGVNRTNRINDYQLSDMKNFDCESFPYLATRRERKLFYNANKMAAICHDTDITDDYKVTGVTSSGNFVYRGNYINCEGQLGGNDYLCEYMGDYVCFPCQQVLTSYQTYYSDSRISEVISLNGKRTAAVYFSCHTISSQTCGSVQINGSKGTFTASCSEWQTMLSGFESSKALSVGKCFIPVFRSCYHISPITTKALPYPKDMFFCIDYIESYGFSFTCYDMRGLEFDYGKWLSENKGSYSGENFPIGWSFDGSNVRLTLGVSSYYGTYSATELQLDYINAPKYLGVSFNGRLFACDVFGVDIFYTSGSAVAGEKYNFTPGTSLGGAGSVQCADHGRWTALIAYGGALYAFKKNGMYRIYSSDGLSFYMDKVADVGAVSQKAVCVVSDVMYFLSETGLYRFTGTYPEELPDNLGRRYTGGVLGGYDNKVYCALSYSGGTELVVYDATVNAYGIHDAFKASGFVTYGGKLYALNSADGYVYEMSGERKALEFSINTRRFFLSFEKKAINGLRLYFDFSGRENEKFEVFVSYDGGGWERCFKPITSGRLKYVPIKFKKCDELCVKIQGKGVFTLKGMTLSLYSGGDIKQNK